MAPLIATTTRQHVFADPTEWINWNNVSDVPHLPSEQSKILHRMDGLGGGLNCHANNESPPI